MNKLKLKFTGKELKAFNWLWEADIRFFHETPHTKMVMAIVKRVAAKFIKKAIDNKEKYTISLEDYEAIALAEYMTVFFLQPNALGMYEQNIINQRWLEIHRELV